jgi:cytochrome c biogenesis protein CcdA
MSHLTSDPPQTILSKNYSLRRRVVWVIVSLALGILIAGFWNYKIVDNFGRNIIANRTIGETAQLAGSFQENGFGFGMIFALIAGVAATFTACNCVIYTMIPGLVCPANKGNSSTKATALWAFFIFVLAVILVGAIYGFYVGMLGVKGAHAYNDPVIRIHQAQVVFSIIGFIMLIWGAITFGLFDRFTKKFPLSIRENISKPTTKAGMLGVLVGFFAIGRPYPVFRDFLGYAAESNNPLYGALVMSIQGLGQIALMAILFLLMLGVFRNRLGRWANEKPYQAELVSAIALIIGGAFFLFYWGIGMSLNISNWGFKMGWYH